MAKLPKSLSEMIVQAEHDPSALTAIINAAVKDSNRSIAGLAQRAVKPDEPITFRFKKQGDDVYAGLPAGTVVKKDSATGLYRPASAHDEPVQFIKTGKVVSITHDPVRARTAFALDNGETCYLTDYELTQMTRAELEQYYGKEIWQGWLHGQTQGRIQSPAEARSVQREGSQDSKRSGSRNAGQLEQEAQEGQKAQEVIEPLPGGFDDIEI